MLSPPQEHRTSEDIFLLQLKRTSALSAVGNNGVLAAHHGVSPFEMLG